MIPSSPDYPLSSAMSEIDGLSDSDWLDISSNGHESDYDDSLASQDSDRDEITSLPQSRRSSISNGSSVAGEVEAWEGFVSDSGDEALGAPSGMYPVPLPAAHEAQPVQVGLAQPLDPDAQVPGPRDEEEQKVRDALDQSFVGTLATSRTSAGGHPASTHTSIRDLRLSFPDPLTSSRDELNRSYEEVSPTETTTSSVFEHEINQSTELIISSPLQDPGTLRSTPEVQRHEIQHLESVEQVELEIVLYGASSILMWRFVQELVQKAATVSGYILVDSVQLEEHEPVQTLRLLKSEGGVLPFFDKITVLDRTDIGIKQEAGFIDSVNRPSLAIVCLPSTDLPSLSWHTSYLPVLIPSATPPDAELDNLAIMRAAEDDWELLSVPWKKVLHLGTSVYQVFDSDQLPYCNAGLVYNALYNMGQETKKPFSKPITEQLKSVNAVKIFALMSIIMGFAINTAFRPPTPTPTPTVTHPAQPVNNHWVLHPNINVSEVVISSGSAKGNSGMATSPSFKDMALSVYSTDATSLSVTSPPTSSLSVVPSSSKAIAEVSTTSKCLQCKPLSSSGVSAKASTDVVIRSTSAAAALSERSTSSVLTQANRGAVVISDIQTGSSGSINLPKATGINAKAVVNSVSEVLDAGAKALAEVVGGTDVSGIIERVDGMIRDQTENFVKQSKGKARAINDEFISRNDRARHNAKHLMKKGEDLISSAHGLLMEGTARAQKRARGLGRTQIVQEAWGVYQKSYEQWDGKLERTKSKESSGASEESKENKRHCWRRQARAVQRL